MKYLRFQHVQTDIPYSLNFCLFKNDIALVVCVALVNTCPFSIKIILYTIFSFINSWTTAQLARPSMVQMPIQLPTPLAHCRPISFSVGEYFFLSYFLPVFLSSFFLSFFLSFFHSFFLSFFIHLFTYYLFNHIYIYIFLP